MQQMLSSSREMPSDLREIVFATAGLEACGGTMGCKWLAASGGKDVDHFCEKTLKCRV
ncbi:MAG: hypothetical protein LBI39_03165 [Puniceicoccales bacterium]|nr:hypothetical protein [Puniceicoccales bacterium]